MSRRRVGWFFFQAEDGIRDIGVTGVQTCALPICRAEEGYVGDGAHATRERRDHHPDHPLHRRGRGDGGPDRGDQQRRDHPGRREDRAHAQARQETADAPAAPRAHRDPERARPLPPRARGGREGAGLYLRYAHRARGYHRPARRPRRGWRQVQRSPDATELARRDLRQPGKGGPMNLHAIRAIYKFEMARTFRTLLQSIVSPVISTALYFVVFGAAIGARITDVDGVSYGAFIVAGLMMVSLSTQSISNASTGIFFPKLTGTIYEILSAPVSYIDVVLGYVGAAATKSVKIGRAHV